MTRAVVTRESEWDDAERDYVTALQVYRDGLCPLCGGPASECQAPESMDEARHGRFVVEHTACLRTRQLRKEMEAVSESSDEPSALVFTTRRRGVVDG